MLLAISGPAVVQGCGTLIALSGAYVNAPRSLFIIARCIYLIYFHPLSRYPGPILAKITNLYGGYHAWKGDVHIDMWRCHQRYGHHVRYAPNRVLFDTQDGLQDIYGYSTNVVKSSVYDVLVHKAPNILTCRDKVQHGRRKRFISQGFSDASLRALEPAIIAQIKKLCDKLVEPSNDDGVSEPISDTNLGWSPTRDMASWCDYLAFDIMSSVIFSGKYDALGKPDFRWVPDAIANSNVRMSVLLQAREVNFWRLDKRLFPKAIEARNRFVKFVSNMLKDRLAFDKSEEATDIFSFLAKAKDPEGGDALTVTELGAESTTLVVAGTDTSSTTMAAVLFYLSHNPEARERVTREVREQFDSAEEIRSGSKLQSCSYLRACIDETLRITPPAGSALWREVLPGGATLDGQHIPAGCDVGIGIYALHHNPECHPEPSVFRPERWIAEEGQSCNSNAKPKAYSPFSAGPRGCIGKSLALMELMLTMASLIYAFDFRAVNEAGVPISDESVHGRARGDADEYETRDHITAAKAGPLLQFRRSH